LDRPRLAELSVRACLPYLITTGTGAVVGAAAELPALPAAPVALTRKM
jgi:hypothetical protein